MGNFDPEAAGILIESGVDVPTALVGSIIDEPRSPMPQARNTGSSRATGVLIGVVVAVAYLVWRSL
jgi:hypothetical protein